MLKTALPLTSQNHLKLRATTALRSIRRGVRDIIEDIANPRLESGFHCQVFNNRGITNRGLTDGGVQERVLVERYEKQKNMRHRSPMAGRAPLRFYAVSPMIIGATPNIKIALPN